MGVSNMNVSTVESWNSVTKVREKWLWYTGDHRKGADLS